MPSDPTGMQPQGVLARPAPDFFDDNLFTGGFFTQPANVSGHDYYMSVSLYNNAQTGLLLKVYGVTASNDVGFGSLMYFVNGTLGSLVGPCTPLRPDVGNQYGQIYYKQDLVVVNAPNPNPLPAVTQQLANPGFSGETWFSPFPLAIVPVGWSLVIVNAIDCGTAQGGFWFQQANE